MPASVGQELKSIYVPFEDLVIIITHQSVWGESFHLSTSCVQRLVAGRSGKLKAER